MKQHIMRLARQHGVHRVAAVFALVAATGLSAGCSGPTFVVQQYSGPVKPREQIAIIRLSGGKAPQLLALDDEQLPPILDTSARMHIEVMPGVHDLQVAAPHLGVNEALTLRLSAQPGKVYRIAVQPTEIDRGLASVPGIAYAYEVDRGSDSPIGAALTPPTDAARSSSSRGGPRLLRNRTLESGAAENPQTAGSQPPSSQPTPPQPSSPPTSLPLPTETPK